MVFWPWSNFVFLDFWISGFLVFGLRSASATPIWEPKANRQALRRSRGLESLAPECYDYFVLSPKFLGTCYWCAIKIFVLFFAISASRRKSQKPKPCPASTSSAPTGSGSGSGSVVGKREGRALRRSRKGERISKEKT